MRKNHFFWSDQIRMRRERRFALIVFSLVLIVWGWLGGDDYKEARRAECTEVGGIYQPADDTCLTPEPRKRPTLLEPRA